MLDLTKHKHTSFNPTHFSTEKDGCLHCSTCGIMPHARATEHPVVRVSAAGPYETGETVVVVSIYCENDGCPPSPYINGMVVEEDSWRPLPHWGKQGVRIEEEIPG